MPWLIKRDQPELITRFNIPLDEYPRRCEVQIAYAIGVPEPVSIMVDSKRTGKISDEKLTRLVRRHFDLTPAGLIRHFRLRRPIYRATAAYGHFGRNEPSFTWERTDKARMLARAV